MINKVTLIGFLGADPEIRTLENGTQVGRFSLATNESWKDKDGEWQTATEWHNVVVWRDLAERAGKNLKKGSLCYVEGKLSHRKYTDQQGQEKSVTDIVANNFRGLEKKEGGNHDSGFPEAEPAGFRNNQTATGNEPIRTDITANHDAKPEGGDDLPF